MKVMAHDPWLIFTAYLRLALRNQAVYRTEFLFRWIALPIELMMVYFLWRLLAEAGFTAGYTVGGLLAYYVVSLFLNRVVPFVRIARDVREDIYQGTIIIYELRRTPPWTVWAAHSVAGLAAYLPVALPLVLLLVALTGTALTWEGIAWFVVLTGLGYTITMQIWYLIGLSSFFTEENMGAARFYQTVQALLGGIMLPIDLFPQWFQQLSNYLPFQYWTYLPAKALVDSTRVGDAFGHLAAGLMWVAALALLSRWVWRRGWEHFTAHNV